MTKFHLIRRMTGVVYFVFGFILGCTTLFLGTPKFIYAQVGSPSIHSKKTSESTTSKKRILKLGSSPFLKRWKRMENKRKNRAQQQASHPVKKESNTSTNSNSHSLSSVLSQDEFKIPRSLFPRYIKALLPKEFKYILLSWSLQWKNKNVVWQGEWGFPQSSEHVKKLIQISLFRQGWWAINQGTLKNTIDHVQWGTLKWTVDAISSEHKKEVSMDVYSSKVTLTWSPKLEWFVHCCLK